MSAVRYERLIELGCIACRIDEFGYTPPEIHHLREGQGMGQRAPDHETIPLCHIHHRLGLKSNVQFLKEFVPGFHSHRQAFIDRYGTERELLIKVDELISEDYFNYGGTD